MEYLQKICCFFVFARIFLHMCPNETYEKYIGALINWVAFCIFLSPFLSGDFFSETYQMWEENWKVQVQEHIGMTEEEMKSESERAAIRIVEEMEPEYEVGEDD